MERALSIKYVHNVHVKMLYRVILLVIVCEYVSFMRHWTDRKTIPCMGTMAFDYSYCKLTLL